MKAAIIGGGIGGMMGALFLSRQGIDVTIYEKENRLGGRLSFVERGGFRIDEGPTIVLLPEMLQQMLDEAGISRRDYKLISCDPLYSIHYRGGLTYTKYPDFNRQMEEIQRVFPNEAEGFKRFMKEGKMRFKIGKQAFLEQEFSNPREFWTRNNVKKLLKLKPYQSVQKLMSAYFRDERLQAAYSLQTLYIGGDPFHAPAMYSLVPFSEHEHGVFYLKGGYASLVKVLERELVRRGTSIQLNSNVAKIIKTGQRVTGLETAEGEQHYDAVIFNGDFPHLTSILHQPAKRSFVPSSGCVLLYFGLNCIYKEANVHQFLMGGNFAGHMRDVFERKQVPEDPAIYAFHPSVIDDSLAPAGKGVLYTLIPVPSDTPIDWKNQRDWIDQIISRLERGPFSGLREAIEWMEIRSPEDAETFGLFKGGSFGIAPSLFQSGVFRPQVKPYPLENLYAVGASIHPGGGIPIVMQGARLMAEQLLQDRSGKGVNVHA